MRSISSASPRQPSQSTAWFGSRIRGSLWPQASSGSRAPSLVGRVRPRTVTPRADTESVSQRPVADLAHAGPVGVAHPMAWAAWPVQRSRHCAKHRDYHASLSGRPANPVRHRAIRLYAGQPLAEQHCSAFRQPALLRPKSNSMAPLPYPRTRRRRPETRVGIRRPCAICVWQARGAGSDPAVPIRTLSPQIPARTAPGSAPFSGGE